MILDKKGGPVAFCVNNRRLGEFTDPDVAAEAARHIVACVNFCGGMSTDLLELLTSGQFQVRLTGISLDPGAGAVHFSAVQRHRHTDPPNSDGPSLRKQLSQAREQFVRDLRNGSAVLRGALPGGAI